MIRRRHNSLSGWNASRRLPVIFYQYGRSVTSPHHQQHSVLFANWLVPADGFSAARHCVPVIGYIFGHWVHLLRTSAGSEPVSNSSIPDVQGCDELGITQAYANLSSPSA